MENKNSPELLLPAGNLEKLKTALLYGADAVYAGHPALSLRTTAETSTEELAIGASLLHQAGKKLYLALNVYSHNYDLEKLAASVKELRHISPDGIIVADAGIFAFLRENLPEIPLHISTQANTCSAMSVKFWKDLGAKLVVLGREVSFAEMREIIERVPDVKVETFIHGAMCMSYSGRCLLSSYMSGRSANRGACSQPCRWQYHLMEEKRPGEYFPIEEDARGSYIMSSRDLCLIEELPNLISAGVSSLKIEGRNKSEYYVACSSRTYRKAIDDWFNDGKNWEPSIYMSELEKLENRGYTKGFFYGTPDDTAQNYETTRSSSDWRNIGVVRGFESDALIMEMRNTLDVGEEIEFLSPYLFEPIKIKMDELIESSKKEKVARASAGHGKSILIKKEVFAKLGIDAEKLLPSLTVARKKFLKEE